MPNMPTITTLTARSVGIINAIRNNASAEYYNAVPRAQATTESIRAVGQAITAYQPRMNEFVNALVNRIAKVVVTSRMYTNPWAFAKKGILAMGESIEEIFVDIAEAHPFDPENSYQNVFKRTKPDVRSMFHAMNLQTKYPVTISQEQLRQAFVTLEGVTDLIAKIVNSLYSAAAYDEFIMMKYVIARLALDGSLPLSTITAVTDETSAKNAIIGMKSNTTKFGFMSNNYTVAGNKNFVDNNDIYVITTADFDAITDVDVLAKAFNMDRANWLGRHVSVDSFAFNAGEIDRLNQLLEKDAMWQTAPLTSNDLTNLATITAIVMDSKFLQVYDVLNQFTENYNGDGLYWNEFYHVWRIYSASPFVNVLMFTSLSKTVTSVTITGATSVAKGARSQYTATVVAGAFTNMGVVWSVDATAEADGVSINQYGLLNVPASATVTSVTVTATSAADSTKTGTKSVTIT